jgi:hypothetical protein
MPIAVGRATETINMDVVANVDRFGDGSMKITFHLSAMQWAIWKQQYGDHPDVLWRDLKQTFAKYALDKFDLQKNDIERTAVVDISAHAFTHVRSDGKRGIEIPKEFRLVSNNWREWIFDFTNQQSPYSPIRPKQTELYFRRSQEMHVSINREPVRNSWFTICVKIPASGRSFSDWACF